MNQEEAQLICTQLNLGTVRTVPLRVFGGLLHRMWKLETEKGTFACKELSKDINLSPSTRQTYELTEQIAKRFNELSVPAISALDVQGKHLIDTADGTFLVYPWQEDVTLSNTAISAPHALTIAKLLAKMHLIDLKVPELPDLALHIYQPQTLISLIERTISRGLSFSKELKAHQEMLLNITQSCQAELPSQHAIMVVSHGDLDQKNVLWDKQGNPTIIDWEAACKLDPTKETIEAALNWSGIQTDNFDKNLFITFINTYIKSGGHIEKDNVYHAFLAILNNLLHWLVHNIENSLSSRSNQVEEQRQYIQQIHLVLKTIPKIKLLMPELIKALASINQQPLDSKKS